MPQNAVHRRQVLRRELIENGIALFVIAIFFGLAILDPVARNALACGI
jgi:hypothetical protein